MRTLHLMKRSSRQRHSTKYSDIPLCHLAASNPARFIAVWWHATTLFVVVGVHCYVEDFSSSSYYSFVFKWNPRAGLDYSKKSATCWPTVSRALTIPRLLNSTTIPSAPSTLKATQCHRIFNTPLRKNIGPGSESTSAASSLPHTAFMAKFQSAETLLIAIPKPRCLFCFISEREPIFHKHRIVISDPHFKQCSRQLM